MSQTNLNTIKWVGKATIEILMDNWISTTEELMGIDTKKLESIITSPITRIQISNFIKSNTSLYEESLRKGKETPKEGRSNG